MKRRKHRTHWQPSAAMACLAVAACAVTPPPPPAPASTPVGVELTHLAQRGHGRDAVFEVCRGGACPQRTPKTIPASPSPAPSPAASSAPAEGVATALPNYANGERAALATSTSGSSPPGAPAPVAPTVEQLSVHFPFASARLDASARAALRQAASHLAQAQDISLSGRTDSTGPAAANDALAQARAQAVLRELLALAPGVASRVRVEAQGVCCFVESNGSAAGRARNRRVEIRYRFDIDDPP